MLGKKELYMLSRQFVSILTVVVALGLAMGAVAQQSGAAGPKLSLVDPVKDFGTVPKGEVLTWDFTVQNAGSTDLQILSVQPDCGCTVANFDKVIKPGQTGRIHAVVETVSFSGPIAKTISVQSNDPSTPMARLTMRADVKPYVQAFPNGFLRYMLQLGQADKQSTILVTEDEEPFQIVSIESPADFIKVDYEKVPVAERVQAGRAGQEQYRFTVTVGGPEAKVGPIAEKVKITTNSKHQPQFLLSVTGLIRPAYVVSPSVLNFGEVKVGDASATRTVTVGATNRTSNAFQVTKVESSNPSIVAEAKPAGNGAFEVTVRLAKPGKAGAFDSNIKIYTNDQYSPVYTLPVRGNITG
ncbi:MAG: DUF1573 domain-containing protein [Thermoanaerobaculia bacterium]